MVVQVQFSAFSSHHAPHPSHPHSPPRFHPLLVLSMCPLQLFLKTLHPFLPIIPSHLPPGYCQFILNFNVSGYILLVKNILYFLKLNSGVPPQLQANEEEIVHQASDSPEAHLLKDLLYKVSRFFFPHFLFLSIWRMGNVKAKKAKSFSKSLHMGLN